MNIDKFYREEVCGRIMQAKEERNVRTNEFVHSVPGLMYQTDLSLEPFPLLSLRKVPLSFIPEQIWFVSGSDNVHWLSRHTGIWDSFAEPDGTVTSAYGHRWRNYKADVVADSHGNRAKLGMFDQLETVLEKLRLDPSSRHGVIMMWDPFTDLITPQKNVPCPYTFTLMIIGGRLHLHLTVRSNDMVLGFPTDVAGFAFLQLMLTQELGVRPGVFTQNISNAHVYSMHEDIVKEMAERRPDALHWPKLAMPDNAYARAKMLDDSLVVDAKNALTGYEPFPAIKNIPIAL